MFFYMVLPDWPVVQFAVQLAYCFLRNQQQGGVVQKFRRLYVHVWVGNSITTVRRERGSLKVWQQVLYYSAWFCCVCKLLSATKTNANNLNYHAASFSLKFSIYRTLRFSPMRRRVFSAQKSVLWNFSNFKSVPAIMDLLRHRSPHFATSLLSYLPRHLLQGYNPT